MEFSGISVMAETPQAESTPTVKVTGAPTNDKTEIEQEMEWKNSVEVRAGGPVVITGLRWRVQRVDAVAVFTGPENKEMIINANLDGIFDHSGWNLVWKSKQVLLDAKKQFRLHVRINAATTTFPLTAIGPAGETEEQTVILVVSQWESILQRLGKFLAPPRPFVTVLLAVSAISYEEQVSIFSSKLFETALTGRLSYNFFIFGSRRWDLGASTYFTLLPLTKTLPDGLRFLGLNVRVGYVFPKTLGSWTFGIYSGGYYTTTFVTGSAKFGFINMTGPQIYPVLRRSLAGGRSIMGYFKFSPMSSQFSLFTYSSYELAFGGIYSKSLSNEHPLSFSLDISRLHFSVPEQTFTGSSSTLSFGVAYGL